MKTISEHNNEMEKLGVTMYTFIDEPTWQPLGIMCPCGCETELLDLHYQYLVRHNNTRIMCQKTKKEGTLFYAHRLKNTIKGIEWDE